MIYQTPTSRRAYLRARYHAKKPRPDTGLIGLVELGALLGIPKPTIRASWKRRVAAGQLPPPLPSATNRVKWPRDQITALLKDAA